MPTRYVLPLLLYTVLFLAHPFAQAVDDVISRVQGAERVVVATVTGTRPMTVVNVWGDQLIVTRTTLVVDEVLRGSAIRTVTVDIEGGTLGDLTLEVSDMPSLGVGDRGVFFLTRTSEARYQLHRRGEGLLRLHQDDVVDHPGMTLDVVRRHLRAGRR